MPLEDFGVSFNHDSRGVSAVIGFLLVFSFIIILLSINQAQFVPQENSEIEFQHYQEVQDDMVEVRSAISTAGQANVSQYPTVELGTSYPTRLFALNPAAPAGTLETRGGYNITLTRSDGTTRNVSSQFIVYQPGYNELGENPIWYENSVLYIDARDNDGRIAVLEDQNLIRGGSQVRINAIQNDFSVTSSGRVTIEIYPTENTDISLDEWTGKVNVKLPTRLNESEYWGSQLDKYDEAHEGVTYHGVDRPDDDIHLVNLTVDANSLKFNTVGIDRAPDGQGSARRGIGVGGTTGGGGGGGGDGGDGGDGVSPTFESVEATVTSESNAPGSPGIEQIRFDWQLSESTDIQLRILDSNGVEVGGTTVNSASIDGSATVNVTSGTNSGGKREPRPVTAEAEITPTGEICSETIESGDGDGPFTLSCA